MIGKDTDRYRHFISDYGIPGEPNLPRCALAMPPAEIERRLMDGRLMAPAVGEHAAYTSAFCRGRRHRAHYIDNPSAKGRAFFCTTFGDPLSPADISFRGCSPTLVLLVSVPCFQVRRHVHTLLVVDTPVLLSSLSDGREWSVVGTSAARAYSYMMAQAEGEEAVWMLRGCSPQMYNPDNRDPASRIEYDGGELQPLPRETRAAVGAALGRAPRVRVHRGIENLGYPWSSVFETARSGLAGYRGEPAVTVLEEDLGSLREALNGEGAEALANLRDVFVTQSTLGADRAVLLRQEDALLTRLDDEDGSHDAVAPPEDIF